MSLDKKIKAGGLLWASDVKQFIKIVEAIMMNTGISRKERVERLNEEAGKGLI